MLRYIMSSVHLPAKISPPTIHDQAKLASMACAGRAPLSYGRVVELRTAIDD